MSTSLATANLKLPEEFADKIVNNVQSGSAVAALSAQEPMRFTKSNIITFNKPPKAEFVEEGGQKSGMDVGFSNVQAVPHKAQVTVRMNEEVRWADEDFQIGVFNTITDSASKALSRALDLGVFHRLNPSTGQPISSWDNYLTSTTKTVNATDNADADIEKAIGLVLNDGEGYDVNGLALSKSTAFNLATVKDKNGRLIYPELGYGVDMTTFKGLKSYVTTTVNAPEATTATNVNAIAGDFANGIYWGIQRQLPIDVIEYGDPDGLGDLKRHNQIAVRLELVYAWYVFADRFAIVKSASAGKGN